MARVYVKLTDFSHDLFNKARCGHCGIPHRNLLEYVRVLDKWICPNHINGALDQFVKIARRKPK